MVKGAHLCDEADSVLGWDCFIDARRNIREYINAITLEVIARKQKCHFMSNVFSVSVFSSLQLPLESCPPPEPDCALNKPKCLHVSIKCRRCTCSQDWLICWFDVKASFSAFESMQKSKWPIITTREKCFNNPERQQILQNSTGR